MTTPRNTYLAEADDRLLAACDVRTHRASGPGGRKRDTTDSAVRLTHRPTGVSAGASESRSQHENRRRALKRLRQAIALEVRERPPPDVGEALRRAAADPGWPRISRKSGDYLPAAAEVLDRLADRNGRVSEVAEAVGASTASLVKFLSLDDRLWQAANRVREAAGQKPLRKP
ncbi:MAG: peptide chain release factor-like protein [Phycisphaerae bacterium]